MQQGRPYPHCGEEKKMLGKTGERFVAKRKEKLQNYLRLLSAHEKFRNDKDDNFEELKKMGASQGAAT